MRRTPAPTYPPSLTLPFLERHDGVSNDAGCLLDCLVGECPVSRLDHVADGGEEGLVVAGPELRAEHDMAKLGAVGDLR